MIKYLILFLLVTVYNLYAQFNEFSEVKEYRYEVLGSYEQPKKDIADDYPRKVKALEDAYEYREYYYNILLNEFLKDANRRELTFEPILGTEWKRTASEWEIYRKIHNGPYGAINDILKRYYGIDIDVRRCPHTFGGAGNKYTYILYLFQGLPEKEQLWVLICRKSRRFVYIKEKIDEPRWKKANLPEIRDNNTYTALLRKLELDGFYQCPPPRILNEPDGNDIDSGRALAIAAASAAVCYDGEMTPIAAKLMGNNKEHWLIYCFPTIQDNANLQEICYKTIVNRYKEGLNLWNWSFFYISDDSIGHHSEIVSLLISRKTGKVLFMEKTGNGCSYRHNSEGRHIGVPSPPQTGPDYLR